MRSQKKEESSDEETDIAYSALKAIVGGLMLWIGWAISASGGFNPILGGFLGIGAWFIASELRETGIARVIFAVTLVGIAVIVFNRGGWEASTPVLAILGISGVILVYEISQRRIFTGS
jgi:CHASE2 domain-containing sensor protein